jgi:transposase
MIRTIGPERLEIRKVTARGRRVYSGESKARLVAASLRPGVSVARLALDHGLNANLLRRWIKIHLAGRSPSGGGMPVPANGSGAFVRLEARDPQYAVRDAEPTSARLSAEMPNGVRLALEGQNLQMLATMIDALGRL